MQTIQLRGAKLLNVVSIIMIIFGAISAGGGAITAGSASFVAGMLGLDEYGITIFRIIGMIAVVAGLVFLVFGIIGIKMRNDPEKTGLLIMLGVILVLANVFTTLCSVAMAPVEVIVTQQMEDATIQMYGVAATNSSIGGVTSDPSMITVGFVLPALFLIGAFLNKLPPKILQPAYAQEPQMAIDYNQNDQQAGQQDYQQADQHTDQQGETGAEDIN